jgi:hypothetical protein
MEPVENAMKTGQSNSTYELFVGIDIAAATAAVATQRPGAKASSVFTIDQTPEGYRGLVNKLHAMDVMPSSVLIVMEATGPYWINLAMHCSNSRSSARSTRVALSP